MSAVVVVMLLALALAATVFVYAAFPYRGADTPVSPLLGRAMRRGVERLPTVDLQQVEEREAELSSTR